MRSLSRSRSGLRNLSLKNWIEKLFGKGGQARTHAGETPLDAAVHRSAVIYEQIPLREFIDERRRSELARELFLEANALFKATDPVTACRDRLVAVTLELGMYQVLMIPPEPEPDEFGLRSQPGISGELREHLVTVCRRNDELRSLVLKHADGEDFDSLWSFLQRRYWETRWLTETINAVRLELGDRVEEEDWDRAFLHAACVKAEHVFRWNLELPPAFEEDIAREATTAYSMFTDIVLAGAGNPLAEWREFHQGIGIPMPDFNR